MSANISSIKGFVCDFFALVLLSVFIFFGISLFSYHEGDASWNVVGSASIQNIMGTRGGMHC